MAEITLDVYGTPYTRESAKAFGTGVFIGAYALIGQCSARCHRFLEVAETDAEAFDHQEEYLESLLAAFHRHHPENLNG
jgi:hypothetical protein